GNNPRNLPKYLEQAAYRRLLYRCFRKETPDPRIVLKGQCINAKFLLIMGRFICPISHIFLDLAL
ncbi:MAG: hypothetical protein AMJ93_11545, partial [Anaerolineae bacterium SM23_84]